METQEPASAWQVLLVEDNPADAVLVEELLASEDDRAERFDVVRADRLSVAIPRIESGPVDVVLLD
jgi:CheY-like chemotaxis protein